MSCGPFEYTHRWQQVREAPEDEEKVRILEERDRELEQHLAECDCDE